MGNVYMEADQVRFKDSTYRNVQEGLAAALEGGGGGGTTVVANPEGSATADLEKLQVGTTIYGIPSEAGDISYDNTSSGLTADDVQEAIDEVATDIGSISTIIGDSSAGLVKEVTDIQDLIPSGATSSNKLATASDIPDAVTGNPSGSATAGNLTKLQIGSDIYDIPAAASSFAMAETGPIQLNNTTWYESGGGIYYAAVENVIPANRKIIGIVPYAISYLSPDNIFMFAQAEGNPRNISILSKTNVMNPNATISLRITHAPV